MLRRVFAIFMASAISLPVTYSFGQMRRVIDSYEIGEILSDEFVRVDLEGLELPDPDGRLQLKPDVSMNGEIAVIPLGFNEFKLVDLRSGKLSNAYRPFPNPNINGEENRIHWIGIAPRGKFISVRGNDNAIVTYSIDQEEGEFVLEELPLIPAAPLKPILPALLDGPSRLVVIETGSKGLLLDIYELPSFNKKSKRVRLSPRFKVQWISIPDEDRITATIWNVNQLRANSLTSSLELFEILPSPHTILRTTSHRWASLKHGTSLNSFLESWPTGQHRLLTLEEEPSRRATFDFRHPIIPDLFYTVIKTTPSGRMLAIGTARVLRSTSAQATIFVSDESLAPEVRTYEFPLDIFSVKPMGFTKNESGLIVACYRFIDKPIEPDVVRISIEIIDLNVRAD